jgi:hypothetical protein
MTKIPLPVKLSPANMNVVRAPAILRRERRWVLKKVLSWTAFVSPRILNSHKNICGRFSNTKELSAAGRASAPVAFSKSNAGVNKTTLEMKALSELDWNFDNVPDNELVACCYWEYARESAFIRELRKRCWEHWQPLYLKGQWWNEPEDKKIHADLQKVQSIGYPAEVFLRGISCPPDGVLPDALPLKPGEIHRTTGSFPKSWQELTKEERAYRAQIGNDVERIPLVPFERGLFLDAKDIVKSVTAQRREKDEADEQARRENPKLTEEALCRMGKLQFPDIRPSVIYGSGAEETIVRINWSAFTNDKIANYFRKWIKANRPTDIRKPDGKGRNKARDRRVVLERLGMMRLLHQLRLREMPTKSLKAWKLYGKREWYKERKRAGETFHRLFPFLSKSERPLSWPTKGGRSK